MCDTFNSKYISIRFKLLNILHTHAPRTHTHMVLGLQLKAPTVTVTDVNCVFLKNLPATISSMEDFRRQLKVVYFNFYEFYPAKVFKLSYRGNEYPILYKSLTSIHLNSKIFQTSEITLSEEQRSLESYPFMTKTHL
jgi:hypothetical protein